MSGFRVSQGGLDVEGRFPDHHGIWRLWSAVCVSSVVFLSSLSLSLLREREAESVFST